MPKCKWNDKLECQSPKMYDRCTSINGKDWIYFDGKMFKCELENNPKWNIKNKELTAIETLEDEGFQITNNTDDPKYSKVVIGIELYENDWNIFSFDENGGANVDYAQGNYERNGTLEMVSKISEIIDYVKKALKEFKELKK